MRHGAQRVFECIPAWVAARCVEFGEGHTRELYADFCAWAYQTRALRAYPGPISWGEAMSAAGYEKRRKFDAGGSLTYWVGVTLRGGEDI